MTQGAGDAEPTPWEAYNRRGAGAPPRERPSSGSACWHAFGVIARKA